MYDADEDCCSSDSIRNIYNRSPTTSASSQYIMQPKFMPTTSVVPCTDTGLGKIKIRLRNPYKTPLRGDYSTPSVLDSQIDAIMATLLSRETSPELAIISPKNDVTEGAIRRNGLFNKSQSLTKLDSFTHGLQRLNTKISDPIGDGFRNLRRINQQRLVIKLGGTIASTESPPKSILLKRRSPLIDSDGSRDESQRLSNSTRKKVVFNQKLSVFVFKRDEAAEQ